MNPTSKFGDLFRGFTHQVMEAKPKARSRLLTGSPALAKRKVIRVLVLGGLMVLGVAVYFNIASGAADNAEQMPPHSLGEDLRIVPNVEWTYSHQDYEAARAANLERRNEEARATIRRVEEYIARNKAYEAALAANQARREAEAQATMQRVEDYIARNKAYEAALAANTEIREDEARATMRRVEEYIAANKAAE